MRRNLYGSQPTPPAPVQIVPRAPPLTNEPIDVGHATHVSTLYAPNTKPPDFDISVENEPESKVIETIPQLNTGTDTTVTSSVDNQRVSAINITPDVRGAAGGGGERQTDLFDQVESDLNDLLHTGAPDSSETRAADPNRPVQTMEIVPDSVRSIGNNDSKDSSASTANTTPAPATESTDEPSLMSL